MTAQCLRLSRDYLTRPFSIGTSTTTIAPTSRTVCYLSICVINFTFFTAWANGLNNALLLSVSQSVSLAWPRFLLPPASPPRLLWRESVHSHRRALNRYPGNVAWLRPGLELAQVNSSANIWPQCQRFVTAKCQTGGVKWIEFVLGLTSSARSGAMNILTANRPEPKPKTKPKLKPKIKIAYSIQEVGAALSQTTSDDGEECGEYDEYAQYWQFIFAQTKGKSISPVAIYAFNPKTYKIHFGLALDTFRREFALIAKPNRRVNT